MRHNLRRPLDANGEEHDCEERRTLLEKNRAEANAHSLQSQFSEDQLAELEQWSEELRDSFKSKSKAKGAGAGH
jgi:hypothetical protein